MRSARPGRTAPALTAGLLAALSACGPADPAPAAPDAAADAAADTAAEDERRAIGEAAEMLEQRRTPAPAGPDTNTEDDGEP